MISSIHTTPFSPHPASTMAFPAPHEGLNLPLPDPEAYPGEPREYATALMQRKDEIEKEIVCGVFQQR